MEMKNNMIKLHFLSAPKGYAEPDGEYRSRFNRVWWFWIPRLHMQSPVVLGGWHNPRVIRIIWLCYAVGVNIGHDGPLEKRKSKNNGGRVGEFLMEYAALVRRTGIYVYRDGGVAMPIESSSNEMETPEQHIARLYREERINQPKV